MNALNTQWRRLSPATRNWIERVFWTAVQSALAVIVVADFTDWNDVRTALVAAVAAAIAALKVSVQQLIAHRAAEASGIVIGDPDAPGMSQTELEQATPQHRGGSLHTTSETPEETR